MGQCFGLNNDILVPAPLPFIEGVSFFLGESIGALRSVRYSVVVLY